MLYGAVHLFLYFVFAHPAGAAAPQVLPPALKVADAIEQSQKFMLEKNRQKALQVLNQSLEGLPQKSRSRARLLESVQQLSSTFFTDKGQRLFEAAQSSVFENPEVGMARYREALALEDNNLLVLMALAHAQLAKQDCSGALQTLGLARQLTAHLQEPQLLEMQAYICAGNYEMFRERFKQLSVVDKNLEYFAQYLSALDLIQQKMWQRAHGLLIRVTELRPDFPEAYSALHKVQRELGERENVFGENYLKLCKAVTVRERKLYSLEPRLCVHTKEVANELEAKD